MMKTILLVIINVVVFVLHTRISLLAADLARLQRKQTELHDRLSELENSLLDELHAFTLELVDDTDIAAAQRARQF
jgi:chaperonin cofactor prefoldin